MNPNYIYRTIYENDDDHDHDPPQQQSTHNNNPTHIFIFLRNNIDY